MWHLLQANVSMHSGQIAQGGVPLLEVASAGHEVEVEATQKMAGLWGW